MSRPIRPLKFLRGLRRCRSGVALTEFAFGLPVLVTMIVVGGEYTNFIVAKMRVSQLALHVADNAARIGAGTQLQAKRISEADINDMFTGANLAAGRLELQARSRVIVSSLEPVAIPNSTNRYQIRWQRCTGTRTVYTSSYGNAGATNLVGMGPVGRQVIAPGEGATMFVEVAYDYKPLFSASLAPATTIREHASMLVRDRRDMTQIYNTPAVTPSNC